MQVWKNKEARRRAGFFAEGRENLKAGIDRRLSVAENSMHILHGTLVVWNNG